MPKRNNIIGVDEVGRGCLAGDVFAAAVLDPSSTSMIEVDTDFSWWDDIRDSKKLSQKKRESLADLITEHCVWAVHQITVGEIDKINILNASLDAMRNSAQEVWRLQLWPEDTLVLVDGNRPLKGLFDGMDQECVKGGDDIIKCIGAASILAKVARDKYMEAMHAAHPDYGWDRNKGYGTAEHREAIMVHGVTPLHRRSFRGVSEYV